MSDWEFEMWWDAVNGMEEEEEDYDDMDDWQSKRARASHIFFTKIKTKTEAAKIFRTSNVRKKFDFKNFFVYN